MSSIWLTDEERQALLPAVTDDGPGLIPGELEEWEREWRRDEAARQLVIFALGVLAGVGITAVVIGMWMMSA